MVKTWGFYGECYLWQMVPGSQQGLAPPQGQALSGIFWGPY